MSGSELTLATVLDAYRDDLLERVDLRPRTVATYLIVLQHLIAWGGERGVSDLGLPDYVRFRRAKGRTERTIDHELNILAIVFRWGKRRGVLPPGAMLRRPRLRVDPRRFRNNHRTPSPGEAGRAIAAMPEGDHKKATLLLARTGARLGEVVHFRCCDLDEGRGLAWFGASEHASKTGVRSFPLDPSSRELLRGRSSPTRAPLFDLGPFANKPNQLRNRLLAGCASVGVDPFTPHGLRRMVVTRLLRAGIDPTVAASLTGHSVGVMLRLYRQVQPVD